MDFFNISDIIDKWEPERLFSKEIREIVGKPKKFTTAKGSGYTFIYKPKHPRANNRGYVPEQILIAESVLGEYLPNGAIVHHVNGIKSDNRKENLVICENNSFHIFLHHRMKRAERNRNR